ncbi:MAG: hypothetical protein EPO26_07475 [Chloroflexota bacterium]|nr:MAG: hypothetical protein EPO26_07475 [Chloroflexota bacterium]
MSDTPTAAAPPAPAPVPIFEREKSRRRGGLVWPLILIAVGAIFLLQNFGILAPNAWHQVWRLWPLVLVLIGIEILFRGRISGVVTGFLVAGLLIGGLAALAVIPRLTLVAGPIETREFEYRLDGATQANVNLEFGAGRLVVGALSAGDGRVGRLTYTGPDALRPNARYSMRNGLGDLRFTIRPGAGEFAVFPNMTADLNRDVPMTLRVTSGASDATIDLTELRVSRFDLETGASSTRIVFPRSAGATEARLRTGAASLVMEVPEGVAAQVRHSGGLSSLDIDQARFPNVERNLYRSADFATNPNRVDVRVDSGASSVTVR